MQVFRLRFANVAATSTQFHGKDVTIPGIEESLRALLGDPEQLKKQLSEKQKELVEQARPLAGSSLQITSDPRTNSIIVRGSGDEIAQVGRIIEALDRPVPMIEMEVVIVRATEGTTRDLGVRWAYESNFTNIGENSNNRFVGVNTGVANADPDAVTGGISAAGTNAAIGGVGSSTFLAGLVRRSSKAALQVQLDALENDSKSQTMASPTLVTVNNVAARVERKASQFVATSEGTTSTLEEIDVGLRLEITPVAILPEDSSQRPLVRMTIVARNTSVAAGAVGAFSETGQEIETEVIMPVGQTFMIGGLLDDRQTKNDGGVPGLRDVPLLGALFSTQGIVDQLNETIFFITPKIVFPEDIQPRDIAARRYMKRRQVGLVKSRTEVQADSKVLQGRAGFIEEDE